MNVTVVLNASINTELLRPGMPSMLTKRLLIHVDKSIMNSKALVDIVFIARIIMLGA